MPLRIAQTGDIHLEQDRYFTDTAQCLEWFVEDAIRANTNLFVVNGDLTTYKQTIQERNLWVDRSFRWAITPRLSWSRVTMARNSMETYMFWHEPRPLTRSIFVPTRR